MFGPWSSCPARNFDLLVPGIALGPTPCPLSTFPSRISVGEDWLTSRMQALETSDVALLIVSQRALDDIAKNAAVQQDSVLLEW